MIYVIIGFLFHVLVIETIRAFLLAAFEAAPCYHPVLVI